MVMLQTRHWKWEIRQSSAMKYSHHYFNLHTHTDAHTHIRPPTCACRRTSRHAYTGKYPCTRRHRHRYAHRRMGTLWLGGGQRGWFARNFTQITTSTPPPWTLPAWRHPPSQNLKNTPTLGHSQAPPIGHCLCDVIIHIPKGLICSFLWPIFSSCFARISPTVCPNFTHCLPEFGGGGSCPPCPPPPHTPMDTPTRTDTRTYTSTSTYTQPNTHTNIRTPIHKASSTHIHYIRTLLQARYIILVSLWATLMLRPIKDVFNYSVT